MRLRKFSIFCFLFLLSVFTLMASRPVEAHYFSILTDSSTAEVGENHAVVLSFTHVLPSGSEYGSKFEATFKMGPITMEMRGGDVEYDVKYVYNDGSSGPSSNTFLYGEKQDVALVELEEKDGTVILSAVSDFTMMIDAGEGESPNPTKGFSKQILNAVSDGGSTRRVGYELEIVPLSDLAGAKVGDTIQFKVVNGSNTPVTGVPIEWADPASAVYIDTEELGPSNLQTLPDLTDDQGVFSYTVTHGGLNALGVGAKDANYVSTLIFDAAKNSGGSGSGGGCDAGLGAVLSLACLPVISAALRKNRG